MGSKRRIAKGILPIILKDRKDGQWYVEPFCGGCNTLDRVEGLRIGADNNLYLVALLKHMQQDNFELPFIGEKEYQEIKLHKENYPEWLIGYVGFQLSFGAKWFGGYRRDKAGVRDYENEAQQNLKAQQNLIKNVLFFHCDYWELEIPKNSIIYCDPPYAGTTKYKDSFDHNKFWTWCEQKVAEGHMVFVSEYHAPQNWKSVWSKKVTTMLDVHEYKEDTENLFILEKIKTP